MKRGWMRLSGARWARHLVGAVGSAWVALEVSAAETRASDVSTSSRCLEPHFV